MVIVLWIRIQITLLCHAQIHVDIILCCSGFLLVFVFGIKNYLGANQYFLVANRHHCFPNKKIIGDRIMPKHFSLLVENYHRVWLMVNVLVCPISVVRFGKNVHILITK